MNEPALGVESLRTQLRYIYNSYRTALLNRKYYRSRLVLFQRYNSVMEVAIAVGAAGSGGVAGLAVLGNNYRTICLAMDIKNGHRSRCCETHITDRRKNRKLYQIIFRI
jgi:hypothetical protein